jgi:hypothetical protein
VATSTLANPLNLLQLFTRIVRPFPPLTYAKSQPEFQVFPTGKAEYHWRIVALGTSKTISRHKSLSFALRKCTRLNEQRSEGASNEIN